MKTNGRNYRMFQYSIQDYMDMHPETSFATWASQEEADKAIDNMRSALNSSTVSDATEVTPLQYFQARQSNYWYGYEDALDMAALDCSQEWIDEYSFYVNRKDMELNSLKKAWEDMFFEGGFAGPQDW